MKTMPANAKKTTRTIAGHTFSLPVGTRCRAERPMGGKGLITVTIRTISMGAVFAGTTLATVTGLTYDQANALLNAFNNGASTFDGRTW